MLVERADLSVEDRVGRGDRELGGARDLLRVTCPPETSTIARKPSHFGSYAQPSPRGSDSVAVASIGA